MDLSGAMKKAVTVEYGTVCSVLYAPSWCTGVLPFSPLRRLANRFSPVLPGFAPSVLAFGCLLQSPVKVWKKMRAQILGSAYSAPLLRQRLHLILQSPCFC